MVAAGGFLAALPFCTPPCTFWGGARRCVLIVLMLVLPGWVAGNLDAGETAAAAAAFDGMGEGCSAAARLLLLVGDCGGGVGDVPEGHSNHKVSTSVGTDCDMLREARTPCHCLT